MESQLIDDYDHVTEFIFYTPNNVPGKGCDLSLFDSQISTYCSCADGCDDVNTCLCLSKNGKIYVNKRLIDETVSGGTTTEGCYIECNSRCSCISSSSRCANRLVQFGPAPHLQIRNFGAKGYGVRTTNAIRKGEFVCEYAGEVIGEEEAAKRCAGDANQKTSTNYVFMLNEFVDERKTTTIVDATCIGNIGRYVNHSCDPNCFVIPVRVDSVTPKLCIFTRRDIQPGDEITYKYGETSNAGLHAVDNSTPRKSCLCGSNICLKYLPFNA